ncbi:MAG: nucleoside kinase [Peptostreptococcaceae bacterium]|nr:nucleoside kinase [Peptostreptococcaceae bacterium]
MEKITILFQEKSYEVEVGKRIADILEEGVLPYSGEELITLATVDNRLKELSYRLTEDCSIELIGLSDADGRRTYMRSLTFLLIRAVQELYLKSTVQVMHSLSNGFFCSLDIGRPLHLEDVRKIEERMRSFVENDEKIVRFSVNIEEAVDIYERQQRKGRTDLFKYRESETVDMYRLGWIEDYFYGYMLPSASKLNLFDLRLYNGGIVLLGPDVKDPKVISRFRHQPKLFRIYRDAAEWTETMKISNVASLNKAIEEERYPELIRLSEAHQEKKICEIADAIKADPEKGKIILIAGPSSSGKTSFAQRLRLQLMVNHLLPVSISVDDYFIDRDATPLDEFGEKDYESIHAIDLQQFNEDLSRLISGYEVHLPSYNFTTGTREYVPGRTISILENQPIIIEGIHALNPLLTEDIPEGNKFRIYISALTQLSLDEHNKIPTTDLRLIRRMVRDQKHRSYGARKTIGMWQSVRRGEEKNIFPFQEYADRMFNSSMVYELAVLKKYVLPLLEDIREDEKEYREAKRLLKFLQYFAQIHDEGDIPPISLLREFIGGSRIVH